MKKKGFVINSIVCAILITLVIGQVLLVKLKVNAENTIGAGLTIGGMSIAGMTVEDAENMVNTYIDGIRPIEVTFIVAAGNKVTTTYDNLGIMWGNPQVIRDEIDAENKGNVIERYKNRKDVEVNGLDLPLDVLFDTAAVESFINTECKIYDESFSNASISRENGEFVIVGGEPGEAVSLSGALVEITDNLYNYYKEGVTEVKLPVNVADPGASMEQLSMIKDLLGTYTTSFSSSGSNRANNVINGCSKLNGTVIFPGEEVSAYKIISPFTTENGYYLAGSYMNGQVVESLGGGICQVTSTLYNAVLLAELEVVERNNHSMVVTYVPKSADAAIAESSGKDFRFKNNTEYPIYIEGITADKKITFNIYGVETRPENRKVEYVSEVLSETVPEDVIKADASLPIGSFSSSPAHIGYTARLWKVVYVDGQETEREIVNNSKYSPSPKTYIVGVATSNPDSYNKMMAAIATGDIATCQSIASQINYLDLLLQQQAAEQNVTP